MNRIRSNCVFIVCGCFLFYCPLLLSHDHFIGSDNWLFQYGDNALWATMDFDDSQWQTVTVPGLILQRHRKETVAWYRVHFDEKNLPTQQQALLIESLRHGDETWLNGVKIGGVGSFPKPWTFSEINPQNLMRVYAIPAELLRKNDNVLAIKISTGFGGGRNAMFPGGSGITGQVYLANAEKLKQQQQQDLIVTSSIDVAFFVFALVDIIIILFLLKNSVQTFPEFKWLVLSSVVMLIGTVGHDFFYIHQFNGVPVTWLLLIALLVTPISVALYFWSQYQNINHHYLTIFLVFWVVLAALILLPFISSDIKLISWYGFLVIAVLCAIYSVFCGIKGVVVGRTGAVAQLLALIVYILSVQTQWLPDGTFAHRNVQIGSLFYRYALLFAYAQQLAYLRLDYKILSARVVNTAENVRHTLARELHDGLGQHLATLKLHIQLHNKTSQTTYGEQIDTELKKALLNLRRLINGLHPIEIEQHCISEALRLECHNLKCQHDIQILFKSQRVNLDKKIEQHVFRMFQECVHNALHHAKATEITVYLRHENKQLILIIEDNGQGFDMMLPCIPTEQGGYGLVSLKERVALLNGQLQIKSQAEMGTKITLMIPTKISLNLQ